MIRTMTRTTAISSGPTLGIERMLAAAGGPLRGFTQPLFADPLAKVEVEAAGGRLRLSLILTPRLAGAIGVLDRPIHAHERDLPDRHAVVDRDRQIRQVGELEGQVPLEARVHEARGAVDDQAEPAER